MDKKKIIIELTSKELTLLFYMAGYSCREATKAFPEEYSSLMKKICSDSSDER